MTARRQRWIAGVVCLGLAACTSVQEVEQQPWYAKAHDASVKAVAVASDQTTKAVSVASEQTSRVYNKMQHYLAEKDVLQTFHDAGEHSESVVLEVLHRTPGKPAAGAAGKSPGTRGTGARGTGSSAAGAGTSGPGTLPDQYSGKLRWPLEAGIVSSEFGARWGKMHKGMDLAADAGEPVFAVAPGEVIYAGNGLRGYGNVVILRHDRQRTSLYAHNSVLKVKQGDVVAEGTLVALLGNTGHSTGPHVHFEIRDGDTPLNPRSVLPATKLGSVVFDPVSTSALAPLAPIGPGGPVRPPAPSSLRRAAPARVAAADSAAPER
jgi:murein DD-endopeptidase MepM/ murein hydrolase activator NlpD